MQDLILPFLLANKQANGKIVNLNESVTKILNLHSYPDNVAKALAELLVINCFLGQNLKQEGVITAQLQSEDGLIKLIVAEYFNNGKIRGYASFEDNEEIYQPDCDFKKLVGNGYLIITLELGNNERYQGIIDLQANSIAEGFVKYLAQSEQIDSLVKITAKKTTILDAPSWKAGGLILKKMPLPKGAEDEWDKYEHYIASINEDELTEIDAEELLHRLFHEEGVIGFDKHNIEFSCHCSREKMAKALEMITSLERENLKSEGKLSVKCQFCDKEELFD